MSEKPSCRKWIVEAAARTARAGAFTDRSSASGAGGSSARTESPCCYIGQRYNRPVMPGTRLEASAPAVDYGTLADLRYHIRRFLRRREEAARAAGIEPQQYLLLLQLKGVEDRGPTTIGALAERLQIRHHSAVELVDRLVERDMVARRRDGHDRREVTVGLRPAGEAVLRKLALYSMQELKTEGPELAKVLRRLMPGRGRARRQAMDGSRTGGAK